MSAQDPNMLFGTMDFSESAILEFSYDQKHGIVVVVCSVSSEIVSDWMRARSQGMSLSEHERDRPFDRDFCFLLFKGVPSLRVGAAWISGSCDLLARVRGQSRTLLNIHVQSFKQTYYACVLVANMEDVEFQFSIVEVKHRFAKMYASADGQKSMMRDIMSGDIVDCDRPFG